MKKYKMIQCGEEKWISEERVREIIGDEEDFEIAKEGFSFIQDDIEIVFKERKESFRYL